ncbi:MAG: NUDIX domain-containing protein [Clostridia bacterium]
MSGYIMDMRRRVGAIPLMQCGASVIVENERGEILLQLRTDNGMWAYTGGSVELYERVEDAAARELEEETGLIAEELTLLGVFSGEEMRYTYPMAIKQAMWTSCSCAENTMARFAASPAKWKASASLRRTRCPCRCWAFIVPHFRAICGSAGLQRCKRPFHDPRIEEE